MNKEKKTLLLMIELFCKKHHSSSPVQSSAFSVQSSDSPVQSSDSPVQRSKFNVESSDSPVQSSNLCSDCNELFEYSVNKITNCPLKENKALCSKCHIHCFDENHRKKIKKVMRYSGPRILFSNPILSFKHIKKYIK